MFPSIDRWDATLWVVTGYIAVVTLVRLMVYQRDRLVAQARAERDIERQRRSRLARLRRREETNVKAPTDRDNAA